MANIVHRFTIDADPATVARLIATKAGIATWWTAHPVTGGEQQGEQLTVHFSDTDPGSATFHVTRTDADAVHWRCIAGPSDWVGTQITFELTPRSDGGTTLRFRHADWAVENEFMSGCSTNWAAYLMSLKSGAEGRGFTPFPAGEMSRWD